MFHTMSNNTELVNSMTKLKLTSQTRLKINLSWGHLVPQFRGADSDNERFTTFHKDSVFHLLKHSLKVVSLVPNE